MNVAIIGECMVELRVSGEASAHIAYSGDTLNTAVYLAREAGSSIDAINYVTALGRDGFSEKMLRFFESEGLRTDLIKRREGKIPGLYAIETDAAGERKFTYWRGESAARTLFSPEDDGVFEALDAFELIYFSGISLAILGDDARARFLDWLGGYRRDGGVVAFDSNYRRALWSSVRQAGAVIEAVWRMTDIGFPSLDDEMALFGDAGEGDVLRRLRSWGVRDGALKRGAAGPVAMSPDVAAPDLAPAEIVVDTTAAGDSFNAGWLASWAKGENAVEQLRAGHDLARTVVGHAGAIIAR